MLYFLKSSKASCLDFSLQDGSSQICIDLIHFHDNIMFILIIILLMVFFFLLFSIVSSNYFRLLIENTIIEFIWTIIPGVILVSIAVPSLALLYSLDEFVDSTLSIKVIGHQWYWSYEYPD